MALVALALATSAKPAAIYAQVATLEGADLGETMQALGLPNLMIFPSSMVSISALVNGDCAITSKRSWDAQRQDMLDNLGSLLGPERPRKDILHIISWNFKIQGPLWPLRGAQSQVHHLNPQAEAAWVLSQLSRSCSTIRQLQERQQASSHKECSATHPNGMASKDNGM